MKVIFLDVDGVLNNDSTRARTPNGFVGIMDSKVKLIKKIADETDSIIVLSTDWRCMDYDDPDYIYLEKKLDKQGLCAFDKTPELDTFRRGREIFTWLQKHENVESYVVLDDIEFSDFNYYKLNRIITDHRRGITEADAEDAIDILNKK